MFMCRHCLEQFEDRDLAYTLVPENRLSHPMVDTFVMRFCSKRHIQEFLQLISHQGQKYVLTRETPQGEKTFPADTALELLLLVGSSKAS